MSNGAPSETVRPPKRHGEREHEIGIPAAAQVHVPGHGLGVEALKIANQSGRLDVGRGLVRLVHGHWIKSFRFFESPLQFGKASIKLVIIHLVHDAEYVLHDDCVSLRAGRISSRNALSLSPSQ